MKGFNKVILAGNVGRDPQIQTFDGRKKASFSLATTNKYRGEDGSLREITDWHNIVVWGNLADIVEGYVRKGTPLLIEEDFVTVNTTIKITYVAELLKSL
jgi:Single-stranded DNA-binding protein